VIARPLILSSRHFGRTLMSLGASQVKINPLWSLKLLGNFVSPRALDALFAARPDGAHCQTLAAGRVFNDRQRAVRLGYSLPSSSILGCVLYSTPLMREA
jgi:hypothetical protein